MKRAMAIVIVLGACKGGDAPAAKPSEPAPPAEPQMAQAAPMKPVPPRQIDMNAIAAATGSGAPTAGSAAGSAAPAAAAPTDAPLAPGVAGKLGPIDLTAKTLDLAALFPGDQLCFETASPAEGTMPPSPDSIHVSRKGLVGGRNGELVLTAELDGKHVTRIIVYAPGIVAPNGVQAGTPARQAATASPDVACSWEGGWWGVVCASEHAPIGYRLDRTSWWGDGDTGSLAAAPADATVDWLLVDVKGMAIAKKPARCAAHE